jgi:hypothetical protein
MSENAPVTWDDQVVELHGLIARLTDRVKALAEQRPPDADAATLFDLWQRLGLPDPGAYFRPSVAAKETMMGIMAVQNDRVPQAWADLAGHIDLGIGQALGRGQEHLDLILTRDFKKVFFLFNEDFTGNVVLAVGAVQSLPDGHRLRSVLPADDFLLTEAGPSLVLGPATRADAGFGSGRRNRTPPSRRTAAAALPSGNTPRRLMASWRPCGVKSR